MTVLDDGNSTVVPVKVTVIDGPEDPFLIMVMEIKQLLTLKIFSCQFLM